MSRRSPGYDQTPRPPGYGPSDLSSAYALNTSTGSEQTVAIVDAFDDPKAESDLAVYRSQYGLPPCTTANGCFRKVDQRGGTTYPAGDVGWAEEESLDINMVSAVCAKTSFHLGWSVGFCRVDGGASGS
jgi:subtilase family serine protease